MKEIVRDNICHISAKMDWRGGEQQLLYLFQELDKLGCSQTVITPDKSELEKRVVRIKPQAVASFTKSRFKPLLLLRIALRIRKVLRSDPGVLFHSHDSDGHTAVVIASLLTRQPIRLVVSRRVDFAVGLSRFSAFKYNHRVVKKIICVSDEVKRVLAPAIKQADKLTVVYDGIDTKRFEGPRDDYFRKTYNLPPDSIIIGNIAAIAPHKDYYTFVDACRLISRQNSRARFFIVGSGPLLRKTEQYVESRQMSGLITFTGFVKNIVPLLKSLDILLYSSKTEGLGSTVLDAFAAGVAVVTTSAGGIAEIAHHNTNALTAPPSDSQTLSQHVISLIADPELRKSLVAGGFQTASLFSKEKMARDTLECYLSC